MRPLVLSSLLIGLVLTTACRPDAGAPVYEHAGDFGGGDSAPPEPVIGADPYQPGEERLSLGIFYEGGFSEEIAIDDEKTHFYVYGLESDGTPTFSLTDDTEFVEEGLTSNRIRHGGTPWWGGGVHWDVPKDLSAWTTISFSLRSTDPAFASVQIHITGGGKTGIVEASTHGFTNDGAWHHVAIPLSEFDGVDWTAVGAPLILVGGGGTKNEELYVDNVYYSKD